MGGVIKENDELKKRLSHSGASSQLGALRENNVITACLMRFLTKGSE